MAALTLEMYARVLAHAACRPGTKLAEILPGLGLTEPDVLAAEAALREQLADAWKNRRGVAAMKFAAALGEELLRLGPVGGLGGRQAPDPAVALTPPRDAEVPSYLRELPALVAPAVPVAAPALPVVAPVSPLAGTANMDMSAVVAAVRRGALPFNPGSSTEAPPEPRPKLELQPPARPGLTGTMDADLSAIVAAVKQGAVPWQREETAASPRPAEAAEPPLLPLATYAEICAALARGEAREDALSRRGLTPDAFDRLARGWSERFQLDLELMATFKEMVRSSAAGGPKGT